MSDLNPRPAADHSVKIPHLVFGLLFLGVAGIWALVVNDVITENRLPILAPAVLIVAGVIGLAASLASTRNRRHRLPGQGAELEPQESDEPRQTDQTDGYDGYDVEIDHTQEIR